MRLPSPVSEPAPIYLLLECADRTDPTEGLADVLGDREALVATDTGERERLWRLREAQTEAISARGVPHKLDVGVPLDRLSEFLERVPDAVRRACSRAETILFGHLGDENVHVNVLGPPPDDPRGDDAVFALVIGLGGTISAEHGVGTAKAGWLERARVLWRADAERDGRRLLGAGILLGLGLLTKTTLVYLAPLLVVVAARHAWHGRARRWRPLATALVTLACRSRSWPHGSPSTSSTSGP